MQPWHFDDNEHVAPVSGNPAFYQYIMNNRYKIGQQWSFCEFFVTNQQVTIGRQALCAVARSLDSTCCLIHE